MRRPELNGLRPDPDAPDCVDIAADDELHTGVIDCVFESHEIRALLKGLEQAQAAANAQGRTAYLVRSLKRIYVTVRKPLDTGDIDALYVASVKPRKPA